MANMQPMGRDQSNGLSDVTYDLVTVLANCGEAIQALDEYIQDAKRDSNPSVQQVFQQIRDNELRHCEILRGVIADQAKQGKF
jgi:hypothetical protein